MATGLARRAWLGGLLGMPVVARAGVDTTDLALACSTALGPVMHRAAGVFREQSGVRLHVFAASPGLVHAQLQREVQIDLVAMGLRDMEDLAVRRLLAPPPYTGPWRNRLVMAGRRGMALTTAMAGTVAVPDAGTAAGLDGPAILAQAGWRPGRRLGVVDTAEAAALLSAGAVTAALLYLSEVRADMLLAELAPVPQAASPDVRVAASVTAEARRPNPAAFLQFLATAFGRRMLAEGGLEELA